MGIIISEQHWYQLIQLHRRKCFDSLETAFESGVHIDFAYRTFIWDSEASIKAHVHCVIVGFSRAVNNKQKIIYSGENAIPANNINGYLLDAENIFIEKE